MFSWLFGGGGGSSTGNVLILRPHKSAIGMPGFPTSSDLRLVSAGGGETVGDVMERFNTYRGPDAQITRLFTLTGAPLEFSTVIVGTMIAIVHGAGAT